MKKVLLLLLLTTSLGISDIFCQSKTIAGQLTDNNGEPLPGVNIIVKGTTIGTVTDLDGSYSIEAPIGSVLVFSSVGFASKEMTVSEDTNEKKPKGEEKSEKKADLSFKPDLILQKEPNGTAVLSPTSPKYAVLNYGNYNKIGEILNQPISYYNFPYHVHDIRYISKKDAWIKYNQASHNGYYIVDSRYTRWLGVRLDYNTSVARNQPTRLPQLQNVYTQGRPENGNTVWRGPETGEIFSWGPKLSNLEFDGTNYPYDANGQLVSLGYGNGGPANAYDPYSFFENGITTTQTIDLNLHYRQKWFANMGYHNYSEKGIISNSQTQSDFFKFELEKKNNKLPDFKYHIDYSETGSGLTNRGGNLANIFYSIASTPPSFDNKNGLPNSDAVKNPISYTTPGNLMRSYSPQAIANPYFIINQNVNTDGSKRLLNYVDLALDLNRVNLAYKFSYDKSTQHQSFAIFQPGFWAQSNLTSSRKSEYENLYSQLHLQFNLQPGNNYKHRVNGSVVGEFTKGHFNFERKNIVAGDLSDNNVTKIIDRKSYTVTEKVSYRFNDLLNLNIQNSSYISNTLSANEYFNPSAGTSVNTHSMPYWLEFISYAKLFSSFSRNVSELGIDHNDLAFNTLNYSSSQFREYFEYDELFYSSELSPEVSEMFEIGSELQFLYGALRTEFTYYNNLRRNAIFPSFSGTKSELTNGADIRNKGLEAHVSYYKYWNNFSWSFNLNFSRNRSIVERLHGNETEKAYAGFSDVHKSLIENQPTGVLVGTRYARNQEGKMIIGGDGYPLVDNSTGIIGDPNPDWTSGIENKLQWRNFGLSFLITIKRGGDVWNGTANVLNYHGASQLTGEERNTRDYIFEGITEEEQRNNTAVNFADPELDISENRWVRYGITGVAEEGIEDGSWIRMKEFGIHYEIPGHRTEHLYISKIKVSAFATNLFLISKYKGVDPQTSLFGYAHTDGFDLFNIPSIRSYGLKLNVTI